MVNLTSTLTSVLALSVADPLSQSVTNGDSLLGTVEAPTLPKFLTENTPLNHGYPWGQRTASGNSPYTDAPNTGVVRRYDFRISRAQLAPDGVVKDMIVVNNQFPGPTIEANWGDIIEVKVTNGLEKEGTALHWHGILQNKTPWFDGVPSVQQCPIAPGGTFTYRFQADLYGSSWWHSHYSAQYAGGLLGPMIIHGPSHLTDAQDYDKDLGPVFLTDWYHREYFDLIKDIMSTDITKVLSAGVSSNNLINGKMAFNCSETNTESCKGTAGISQFRFTTGQRHRLRLINGGSEGQQQFSIDEHELLVIAHDFVPIEPYTAKSVTLGIGQRIDVVVQATGQRGKSYWMRSQIGTACTPSTQGLALATVHYPGANRQNLPTSTGYTDLPACADSNKALEDTVPIFKIKPKTPTVTHKLAITFGQNETGHWTWKMNNSSFRANFNAPILLLAHERNFTYPSQWNVINSWANSTIRVELKNNSPVRHPMHLHGHNMFELASGPGDWDGTIVNPENPARRDTHIIEANGHYVLQYEADNPGVWPFHCHIAWHVSGGLYVNLMEKSMDIREREIPGVMAQTCRDWWSWSGSNVVEQIDSGL